ncbi:MAG: hypothetical protein M0T78_01095 [Actinomycetota bacterium]|nr:hypothetical protein [Actinomycetota bacterium]
MEFRVEAIKEGVIVLKLILAVEILSSLDRSSGEIPKVASHSGVSRITLMDLL